MPATSKPEEHSTATLGEPEVYGLTSFWDYAKAEAQSNVVLPVDQHTYMDVRTVGVSAERPLMVSCAGIPMRTSFMDIGNVLWAGDRSFGHGGEPTLHRGSPRCNGVGSERRYWRCGLLQSRRVEVWTGFPPKSDSRRPQLNSRGVRIFQPVTPGLSVLVGAGLGILGWRYTRDRTEPSK